MRYLRVFTNSAIAGILLSAYLLVTTLHLNPVFPLALGEIGPLAVAMGLAYGANALVVFYALVVLRQVAAVQVLSPGWLSVRVLAWMCTISAAVGAAVLWLNAGDFAPFLSPESGRRMTLAAIAVAIYGGVFLIVALAHIGRRGTAPSGVLIVTTMALSVAVPIMLRGPARKPVAAPVQTPATRVDDRPGGRVVLLAIDGASLDRISVAVAEGRLPNFGRVLDSGVATHLATLRPTQAEPVWTTVATGRLPQTSGVRSAARYRVRAGGAALDVLPDYMFAQALVRYGFLQEESITPGAMAAKPLWTILSERGIRVGLVGWPLTHPAPELRGYVVSDLLHRVDDGRLALEGGAAVTPLSMWAKIAAVRGIALSPDPHDVLAKADGLPHSEVDVRADPQPVQADSLHLRILETLEAGRASRFVAVRLPGLDAVAHYYLRYASPEEFGDVSDDERRRFGGVLDEYYAVLDAVVGRLYDSLQPEDLVIVVSSHGMEPLTPVKRILERLVGDPLVSGTHERAPDGFVVAFGSAVRPGRPDRGSVADIAPTVLYFLGLPIGRDMDGRARTDFFSPEFTSTRPVTFIPSYGR
ncbi:MAG TPA: alkaline phosphatase family protein [Vicinamibacterales bacterium]|nr:alkaline phosphatase family protein [Vicinamibacterales bacterium]